MAIKRIVDMGFWEDNTVMEQFTPEDKLFFLYLMTNTHSSQLGVYAINKKQMGFELGYSSETISILIDRFQNKYGMIKYSEATREVAIKNYLRYSIVKGGKPVEDLLNKEIKAVKDKGLLQFVYDNLCEYGKTEELNETVKKIMPNLNQCVSLDDTPHDTHNDWYPNENDNENVNDNDNDNAYNENEVSKKVSNKEKERKIESYNEIFKSMYVEGRYKEVVLEFIKHLKISFGITMLNDRLNNLLVKLDLKYGQDELSKRKEIRRAIINGYKRLECEEVE